MWILGLKGLKFLAHAVSSLLEDNSLIITFTVILLPLHLASLTHKNPQRHKIIHGMHPIRCHRMQRTINRFEDH